MKTEFKNSITYQLLLEKKKINKLNNKERLDYLNKKKVIKQINSIGNNSQTIIILKNNIVIKSLKKNFHGYTLWKNEINSLMKLNEYIFFPDIIAIDPSHLLIYMSYCGKTLRETKNIPANWKIQYKKIKNILIKKQINPNDININNICILDGVIKLIDFGLANNKSNDINKSLDKLYWLLHNHNK